MVATLASEGSLLPLPNDPSLPLFTYGSLKPGQLAHHQIESYVSSADSDAYVAGHILRTRDGLPLLLKGDDHALGALLWFGEQATSAYEAVCHYEPSHQYRWSKVDVNGTSGTFAANVLLPKRPTKGTDDHELDGEWSSAFDLVLGHGLSTVSLLAEKANGDEPSTLGASWAFAKPFFLMQAAFLLACSVAERYSSLCFGPDLNPGSRVTMLATRGSFRSALQSAQVRKGQRVVDSRNPENHVEIGADGAKAWNYWYGVRSNLSHRGKGANRDADIVREALVDLHDVLRLMLKQDVPGIERQWRDADPDGEDHDWLLRNRFAWARKRAISDT